MERYEVAKKIILETLAWSPFELCEDEVADADRFYQLLQLAALISDEDKAKDVIYAALKSRIHELSAAKADEIDEAIAEDEGRARHDRRMADLIWSR